MAERNVDIETVVIVNEIVNHVREATGQNVVQVQMVDPPLKSELPYLNQTGIENDDFMILKAFILSGVECLLMCCKSEFNKESDWDMWLATRESGYQLVPNKIGDAFKVPHGTNLEEAAQGVIDNFLTRFPGEEYFLDWIKRNDEKIKEAGVL